MDIPPNRNQGKRDDTNHLCPDAALAARSRQKSMFLTGGLGDLFSSSSTQSEAIPAAPFAQIERQSFLDTLENDS
jgi:hypothetical protein